MRAFHRHARASLAQKMGLETREAWHKTDFDRVKDEPDTVSMPNPDWLFSHRPQNYAYEEFDLAAAAVETGSEYVATNVPPPEINHRMNDFKEDKAKSSNGDIPLQAKI